MLLACGVDVCAGDVVEGDECVFEGCASTSGYGVGCAWDNEWLDYDQYA